MKKMIVLLMALTFVLGITAMAFAAEEKKPVAGPGTPTPPPTISAEEKLQLDEAKKKATTKPKAVKEGAGLPSTLGPEEKQQAAEAKKKATAKEKPTVKDSGKATLGPEEKLQMEEAKKKSSAQKRKEKKEKQMMEKEAAPAPAEKK